MEPSQQLVASGLERHRQGDLAGATECYQRALALAPADANAWNFLGLAALQQGAQHQAIDCIAKAIASAPHHAPFRLNLGNALLDAGRLADAEAAFRKTIELAPDLATAWLRLGFCLERQQRLDDALAAYQRASELSPASAEGWSAWAELLARTARWHEARAVYERHLADDASAAALSNYGNVLLALGEAESATGVYRRATALAPRLAEPHFNLGTALARGRQHEEAAREFHAALIEQPTLIEAHTRLADCQAALGDVAAAQQSLDRVVAARPGRLLPLLRRELSWPLVWESNAAIDACRAALATRLTQWSAERLKIDLAELDGCGAEPPVRLAYQGRDDRGLKHAFAELFAPLFPRQELPARLGQPHVGWVVTAGHEGIFLRGMAGVLCRLDSSQLRTTIVCHSSGLAQLKAHLQRLPGGAAIEFLAASSLASLVTAIRKTRFDLLYYWEVGTDSTNYFLPYFQLAPLQCTSWGWPVTSGIPAMDFFLSSEWLEPRAAAPHYSERLVQFRHVPNYYERPPGPESGADRSRFGFADRDTIYLCPQNPLKIQPDFDDLVAMLLDSDSRAIVALIESAQPAVTQSLMRRMNHRGPRFAERVRWLPRMGKRDYRRLLAAADVLLDTLHYGGGANTTYDAIAAGTPLVTLPGAFHRGRYAHGAYRRMGLEAYTASDAQSYVRLAVRLAHESDFRREWQTQIAERSDVLFGNLPAVRELEAWMLEAIAASRAGRGGPASTEQAD